MAFCRSLLVFLCTNVGHPWLQSLRGVPAWVWGTHGPQGCPWPGVGHTWVQSLRGVPSRCGVTSVSWGCPSSVREHLLPRACLQPCPQPCCFPHVPSILFPFLSQNTSVPQVSPAPVATFFNYVRAEVPRAPLTGCSFEVLTVVSESAGPCGDQPWTSSTQSPWLPPQVPPWCTSWHTLPFRPCRNLGTFPNLPVLGVTP